VFWWDAVQGAGRAAWSFPSSDRQRSIALTRAARMSWLFMDSRLALGFNCGSGETTALPVFARHDFSQGVFL